MTFIQMEAYRPYLQVIQSLLLKNYVSAKGCCFVEVRCVIASDRAVTRQRSCPPALEEGCSCGSPFHRSGERAGEVPPGMCTNIWKQRELKYNVNRNC